LYKNPPNFPQKFFENSQKIRHPPNANFTHQPNSKIVKFGGKIAHLSTLTASLTTAEPRHMHYNIVCDVTNRTVFIMSSQWMIS